MVLNIRPFPLKERWRVFSGSMLAIVSTGHVDAVDVGDVRSEVSAGGADDPEGAVFAACINQ